MRSTIAGALLQEVVEAVMCALCGARVLFVASIFCWLLHFVLGFNEAVVALFGLIAYFVLVSFITHVGRKYFMSLHSLSELKVAYGTISHRINKIFFYTALTILMGTCCYVLSRLP